MLKKVVIIELFASPAKIEMERNDTEGGDAEQDEVEQAILSIEAIPANIGHYAQIYGEDNRNYYGTLHD